MAATLFAAEPSAPQPPTVLVVVGAAGENEYADAFAAAAEQWTKTTAKAGAKLVLLGLEAAGATSDRERLQQALAAEAKDGPAELWLVLIGHGTFDGKEAKFNLRGNDVAAPELAEWLKPFKRPLAIIDTASSSAPFLAKLSGPNRAIVTSTRSGYEQNFARFGKFFTEAVGDPASDLDKDGQVSLLEAFLSGARRTAEFYKTEQRLATEHALLDDNGDGLGTPAEWFRGVRATKQAKDGASLDGTRAHQLHLVRSTEENQLSPELRARRDALELAVAKLREGKAKLASDEYYVRLEKVLLDLARIYAPQ
ncbi:MAG: hypothetical protein HZA93_07080 [Verrucomicrobia bacterium]|nr:hypothetical protein [Verrucomicrobiota bacterium]